MRPLVAVLAALPALSGCFSPAAEDLGAASLDWDIRSPASRVVETGRTVEFDLYLHNMPAHEVYPGAAMQMWGFSLSPDPQTTSVPGPTLRVTAGDRVKVLFHNTLAGFEHTVHFHGQHVPWDMDGTPYMSQEPVQPGGEFLYEFVAKPSGTFWYHCHVDATHHVDMGMYGALVVDPANLADDPAYSRDYVLLLDESDKNHVTTIDPRNQNQPQSGDPFAYEAWLRRQAQDGVNKNQQAQGAITGTPLKPEREWWPDTEPAYVADYNTYTINGVSFPYTEPLTIRDDEVIRVRLVNVGNEPHSMHLHGHTFLVTHKDGALLAAPFWSDTLLIGPGERYDFYVRGENSGVWDFHDHASANANDNVWPGGMMTVLAYEQHADKVMNMRRDHGASSEALWTVRHAGSLASGAFVRWYALA